MLRKGYAYRMRRTVVPEEVLPGMPEGDALAYCLARGLRFRVEGKDLADRQYDANRINAQVGAGGRVQYCWRG